MIRSDASNFLFQPALPPINLIQAYLAQISGASTSSLPVQSLQPQGPQSKKPSKGVKGYPDGWQTLLNSAKDVVRGSILLKNPFPGANLARITVTEGFHEALSLECGTNGLVLEPGSYSDELQTISLRLHKKYRIFVV